jgi:hypothetical protein
MLVLRIWEGCGGIVFSPDYPSLTCAAPLRNLVRGVLDPCPDIPLCHSVLNSYRSGVSVGLETGV